MRIRIERVDVHVEICGGTPVPVPHRFAASPKASQSVLRIDGNPVLCAGDRFTNEAAPDHRQPKQGRFAATPSQRGSFTAAGQSCLFIDDISAMSRAGRLKTCNDGVVEASCSTATLPRARPCLFVDDEPVLGGGSP